MKNNRTLFPLIKDRLVVDLNADRITTSGVTTSFINPFSYLRLRKSDIDLQPIKYWGVDGTSLQVLLRKTLRRPIERCSFDFTSLAHPVFSKLSNCGMTIFIIGSDTTSIQKFVSTIREHYPRLNISGFRNGYFDTDDDVKSTIANIIRLAPDFVLVGMGAVKQEWFIGELVRSGYIGACASCGGFIHQTATSGIAYYPYWIDRYNLRFIYRIYDEPSLARRYLIEYPKSFAVLAADLTRYLSKADD